jgi:hypothetical protein
LELSISPLLSPHTRLSKAEDPALEVTEGHLSMPIFLAGHPSEAKVVSTQDLLHVGRSGWRTESRKRILERLLF